MSEALTQHNIEQIKKTFEEELKRFSEYHLIPKLKKLIEEIVHDELKTLKDESKYMREQFLEKDEAIARLQEIKGLLPKEEIQKEGSNINTYGS